MTDRVPKLVSVRGGTAALLRVGQLYLDGCRWAEAIAEFEKALAIDPGFAVARLFQAKAYLGQKNFAEAERCCREARQLEPELAQPHLLLGHIHYRQGCLDEAQGDYESAARCDPALAPAHAMLGVVFRERAEWARSRMALEDALRLRADGGGAWLHLTLGEVCFEMGDLKAATRFLKKALELDPYSSRAHYRLGTIYQRAGFDADAGAEFDLAAACNPSEAVGAFARGVLAMKARKFAQASEIMLELVERYPRLPQMHLALGEVFFRSGKNEEALAEFQHAMKLNPAQPLPYFKTALVYRALGRVPEAIEEMEETLRRNPEMIAARLALAGLLVENGDPDAAHEQYRHSISCTDRENDPE